MASSSVKTRRVDESLRKMDLIGDVAHQVRGAKLPSNRQTLKVLFYNWRFVLVKINARLAIDAVVIFW